MRRILQQRETEKKKKAKVLKKEKEQTGKGGKYLNKIEKVKKINKMKELSNKVRSFAIKMTAKAGLTKDQWFVKKEKELEIGETVRTEWTGIGWLKGTVTKKYRTGKYDIKFDCDGKEEKGFSLEEIEVYKPFKVGEAVKVDFGELGWIEGIIDAKHQEKWEVYFPEDGDIQEKVEEKEMKHIPVTHSCDKCGQEKESRKHALEECEWNGQWRHTIEEYERTTQYQVGVSPTTPLWPWDLQSQGLDRTLTMAWAIWCIRKHHEYKKEIDKKTALRIWKRNRNEYIYLKQTREGEVEDVQSADYLAQTSWANFIDPSREEEE